jgi:putative hydrolases of HD superfamily
MIKREQVKKAASFLYEVGTMRKIARSHMQTLLTDDFSDNIASHSFRVAWVGYLLAKMENADANKILLMCLAHDTSEARSSDQNWVHKKYVKVFEDEITKDQIKDLPGENDLKKIISEYKERETQEAKISKDADLIDQILLLKEYVVKGNKEAAIWLDGKNGKRGNKQFQLLKTKSGKKLAIEILKQNPTNWWKNVWTEKRR